MSLIRQCIQHLANQSPATIAIDDGQSQLRYQQLADTLPELLTHCQWLHGKSIAVVGGNSISWILTDLILMELPVRVVPIPDFFSQEQVDHIIKSAGIEIIIGTKTSLEPFSKKTALTALDDRHNIFYVNQKTQPHTPHDHYEKITFTSGSTGTPKGVRLTLDTLENTARSIAKPLATLSIKTHLSAMPFSTLLENVAGLYVSLMEGVTLQVRPLQDLGFKGVSQFDVFTFLNCINDIEPHSTILVPQLLMALTIAHERGLPLKKSFKFIAVGGGKVAPNLLHRTKTAGFPVYEGYGLSECGSVVCLNLPGAEKFGSVGKPLPHCAVRIAKDGSILVSGSIMRGYLDEPEQRIQEIDTGDLGWIDEDGFVHISGRKKNMFITAFGRNVNPEWIEAELLSQPEIQQAAVFGEAQTVNSALIVVRNGFTWESALTAINTINQRLPDYAQIKNPIEIKTPFSAENNTLTANGRLKREAIQQLHHDLLYPQEISLNPTDSSIHDKRVCAS